MMRTNGMLGSGPKVSVIMNCLNCSRYLREAIDSVYAQTMENWEIVFWDNASSDTSADIAQSYIVRSYDSPGVLLHYSTPIHSSKSSNGIEHTPRHLMANLDNASVR